MKKLIKKINELRPTKGIMKINVWPKHAYYYGYTDAINKVIELIKEHEKVLDD